MKKTISFLCLLLIGIAQVQAQETYTYSNPNRDFFDGKDLFVQQKYTAALSSFERFVKKRHAAEPELLQEAAYYEAAIAYQLRNENASQLLAEYLEKYPHTLFEDRVYYMQGNLAFEQKQYNLALSHYGNLTERRLSKTEQAEVAFNKGYAYLETGEFSKAKSSFRSLKGKKSKYDNAAAYYYAYTEYSLKNYESALEDFLAIEHLPEYSGFVPYYIIQIYYFQHEYDKLKPYAETVLERNPQNTNNTEVYRILGECAYQNKDYAGTIKYLSVYQKTAKKVLRNDMYLLGISYYETGDYAAAADCLAKVTTVQDSLAQNAYLHLGNSYVKTEEKNAARMAFRSASEMDFDSSVKEEAAYNYALATLETTTPFGESIKAFEDFLATYPASKYRDKIYENLVTAYMSSKNYAAADASLSKLKTLSPAMKNVKAYILFQLGTEEFVKQNYEQAAHRFSESLSTATSNFKDAQVYYWRGESYYRLGEYDKARKDFIEFPTRRGAAEFSDRELVNYQIAYTFFQQKNYKEAASYFKKYIDSENSSSTANYTDALDRLGDCYFAQRDLINAEKYYTQSFSTGGKNGDYAAFQRAIVQGLRRNYNGKITGLQNLMKFYPKSEYCDDAYYEMARAYVLIDQKDKALEAYYSLTEKYPQSPLARKSSLDIGMLYYNEGKTDDAIAAFKLVIANYPNSEETRTALETLETIYVERNEVDSYFAYTKTLDRSIVPSDATREDSLSFLAAERLYMKSDFAAAQTALEKYTGNFCPDSKNCIAARYYLAESYFANEQKTQALEQYKILAQLSGNAYEEAVLVRLAQISYDEKDYQTALDAFRRLQITAQEPENVVAARVGILRCSYLLGDVASTIAIGNEILGGKEINSEVNNEARFYLAKAYIENNERDNALPYLKELAKNLKTAAGAESKYLLADDYFQRGNDKKAEDEINDFIKTGTPYQYWLARSFILLADIYVKRGDDFQAKQYLMSLQSNYKAEDAIHNLIQERLDEIALRENSTIIQ
ncbi:MAG: tetratricopeptide repeat protein [Prevotellaceae bacterium]|jgi:tetratricopeptide (TPR) repeat protein|nr:tetratricopeptide repeat protein [Prevotellaceae bacterium]